MKFLRFQLDKTSITLLLISDKAIPLSSPRNARNRCKVKKNNPNRQAIEEIISDLAGTFPSLAPFPCSAHGISGMQVAIVAMQAAFVTSQVASL